MKHYITGKDGTKYVVEELGWLEGFVYINVCSSYGYTSHRLKMYYRHERTWDDHMGNTPCGYYANVPLNKHETKRVYLTLAR